MTAVGSWIPLGGVCSGLDVTPPEGSLTLCSHLSLTEGCFWVENVLALRPAPPVSPENALRQRVTVYVAG